MMDLKSLIEKIFEVDNNIRYVAIADSKYQLIESKMRETIPTLTSDKIDAAFFSWVPPVMIEGVSKLSPYVGPVTSVTIRYEKLLAVCIPVEKYVVALTLNPATKVSAFDIAASVRALIEAKMV
jgi:hypothetical protein